MKIITVSDMECGDKPTKYCAAIKNERDWDDLESHMKKGLAACGADPDSFGMDLGVAMCHVMDYLYGWICERFLIEVNEIEEGENDES